MRRILVFCFLTATGFAQRGGGGPAGHLREVTVSAIPGVIAADASWTLVWQGVDNADGIVGTPDGGLLFAQEQPGQVAKLDSTASNTGRSAAVSCTRMPPTTLTNTS